MREEDAGANLTLTFKQRFPSTSSFKHQLEDETEVAAA
jgi:hypothetical protein